MDVFISWSGPRSKKLAEILSEWLPTVIQAVKPYFTPDDIAKGTKWNSEISKQLEACQIGLICITPDNYLAPWINFEAGALSKNLDKSRVCPILFDLEPTNITGPLVQFQLTQFNKDDFKRLIDTINSGLGDGRIAEHTLNTIFEMWWPKLEEKVREESAKRVKAAEKSVKRTDHELLEELLLLVRSQEEHRQPQIEADAISDLVIRFQSLVEEIYSLGYIGPLRMPLDRLWRPLRYIVNRLSENSRDRDAIQDVRLMLSAKRVEKERIIRRAAENEVPMQTSLAEDAEDKNEASGP